MLLLHLSFVCVCVWGGGFLSKKLLENITNLKYFQIPSFFWDICHHLMKLVDIIGEESYFIFCRLIFVALYLKKKYFFEANIGWDSQCSHYLEERNMLLACHRIDNALCVHKNTLKTVFNLFKAFNIESNAKAPRDNCVRCPRARLLNQKINLYGVW